MGAPLTAKDIQAVQFSKSSPGYSPTAVNRFLLAVQARLEGHGTLSATEVRDTVFRTPSLSSWGYDKGEVDDLKTHIITTLTALEAR